MPVQMQVTIKPDLKGVEQARSRLTNLRPLLRIWGQTARSSVVRNFEVGGRPKSWKPSIRVRKKGGLTLVLSGALRQSVAGVEPQVTDTTVSIGTNKVYARIHQFGGVIETGPRKYRLAFQRNKNGELVFMSRKDEKRRKKSVASVRSGMSGGAYIPIPARPFLLLQTEDIQEMRRAASEWIGGGR